MKKRRAGTEGGANGGPRAKREREEEEACVGVACKVLCYSLVGGRSSRCAVSLMCEPEGPAGQCVVAARLVA